MKKYFKLIILSVIAYSIFTCFSANMILASESDDLIQKALDSVRNGRFSKALKDLKTIIEQDPLSPEGYFFISLSYFIRLIYNSDNEQFLKEFEYYLIESISRGKAQIKSGNGSDETELFLGTSYLLESYYKALQKEYFGSAFSARKGKKILERALRRNPELFDAYFGLGIYNYYADRVPSIVKGLRFLLFLPGGDSEKGLSQLALSSSKAKYFNIESSLILAEIHAGKHERDYYEAYLELSKLVDAGQDLLLAWHAIARLEMKILNYYKASEILEGALREAEQNDSDSDVTRLMRLHLAQCYHYNFRSDQSLLQLEKLFEQSEGQSDSMVELSYDLAIHVFGIRNEMDLWEEWKDRFPKLSSQFTATMNLVIYSEEIRCNFQTYLKASQAAEEGDFETAFSLLENISLPCRENHRWILVKGEMKLKSGQAEEALDILMEILRSSSEVSEEVKAVAELRVGNCYDALGKRSSAKQYYERLSLRTSPAQKAAYFYLKSPFELHTYFPYRFQTE
jgi:tetratricopeptide (TPR) repeat protein